MRFRLGLVTGFASGYYLGTRAGRQRYDQINRQLTRLKRSEAFDEAAARARSVVSDGVEKARSLVDRDDDDGGGASANGSGAEGATTLIIATETAPEPTAEIILPGQPQATTVTDTGAGTATEGGYSSSR